MIKQAFILAAGKGTRMKELTAQTPKPLLVYQGKALIDYIIEAFEAYGIERLIINIHTHADKMRAHLKNKNVLISDESQTLQGTGGAIGFAYQEGLLLDQPVFTHNCDAFFSSQKPADNAWANILSALAATWQTDKMDALLLLNAIYNKMGQDKTRQGDFALDQNNKIISAPAAANKNKNYTYTGVQILSPLLFKDKTTEMETLWQRAQEKQRLYGFKLQHNQWQHLGTKEEFVNNNLSPPAN